MPESNRKFWRGVRPVYPDEAFSVKQATPTNLLAAIAHYLATPSALTDGDYTPALVDQYGRTIVTQHEKDRDITKWGGTAVTGRDISLDLKALIDDSIKGLMRSIGDAGASPTNTEGNTALDHLYNIVNKLYGVIKNDLYSCNGEALTARDIAHDLQMLSDDGYKGILRSIGDAGDTPSNTTGKTLLQLLSDILAGNVVTQSTHANLKADAYKPASAVADMSAIESVKAETISATAAAGANTLSSTAVPAGKMQLIQLVNSINETSAITYRIHTTDGAHGYYPIDNGGELAQWGELPTRPNILLGAGDYIGAILGGCTAGDTIRLYVRGNQIDQY